MNDKHENTIIEIMQAIENGVSVVELKQRFPEHKAIIAEILATQQLLRQATIMIPLPVTKSEFYRIIKTEGSVISPYINKLISSMNYKVAVPVLVFGLVAVSGSMFLFGQKGNQGNQIDATPTETIQTTEDTTDVTDKDTRVDDSNNSDSASAAETKPVNNTNPNPNTNTNNQAVSDGAIDNILLEFTADATNEQTVSADDGVTVDMFAEGELSDFEIDDYVY